MAPDTSDRLRYFLEAVGEGLETLDDDRIREVLFRRLMEASGAHRGCLALYDLYDKLNVVDERGLLGDDPKFPASALAEARRAMEGRTGHVSEGDADPWAGARVGSTWPGSGLWIPVPGRDQPLGATYLEGFDGDRPTADDRWYLEALARHLGATLGTAQLYREHEKKKTRIEKLNKVLEVKLHTQTLKIKQMANELENSRRQIQLKYNYERIIGKSAKMREIFEILDKVIDSNLPVLVSGESGTGKELIAKAIHYNGKRKDQTFVSENCAAIGETLFESELFGYEKGAFTGADETKPGLFEVADGGTLFLDEIGDLNLENQKKLLRALQEGEIRRVGGKVAIPVDVRIISATNRTLDEMIAEGSFREDLYYRLKVVSIKLPPLRERVEDIPLLVEYFLDEIATEQGTETIEMTASTMRSFLDYGWPGNVRELENEVRRLVIMGEEDFKPGATTSVRRFQGAGPQMPAGLGLEDAVALYERELIVSALEDTDWNKSQAARELKVGRMKLHRKMEKLGLDKPPGQ